MNVADLFCGCGGMTVGIGEAARELGCRLHVSLAMDNDPSAVDIFNRNIQGANGIVADLQHIFDGDIGGPLTTSERQFRKAMGPIDLLLGGPPCQGHSDLNNHTRRSDPKNVLLTTMARAAEVLRPSVVVIENVPTVRWDRAGVLELTSEALFAAGYRTFGSVIKLSELGVPQRRRRYLLIASKHSSISPSTVLSTLVSSSVDHSERTVRWAIHDLMARDSAGVYDSVGRVTEENRRHIAFLFDKAMYDLPNELRPKCHRDGNHSYVSVYGRLHWNRPAQTITTGFGSMGQGRYVHPQRRRTITPHEAARLQTFPDWFDFGEKTPRSVLAKVIGNAVPPLLMREVGRIIIPGYFQGLAKVWPR
jgi:DNA (cytosine-5)-methyltransferase 1